MALTAANRAALDRVRADARRERPRHRERIARLLGAAGVDATGGARLMRWQAFCARGLARRLAERLGAAVIGRAAGEAAGFPDRLQEPQKPVADGRRPRRAAAVTADVTPRGRPTAATAPAA